MQVFGQIDWDKSEAKLPPENPRFRIRRNDVGRVLVTNIMTVGSVEVDCYSLKPNEEWELEDNNIVSIYGWKIETESGTSCAGNELEYLYGFDPKSLELVRHDPDRHGASVEAKGVVKTFKRADGSLAGISDVSFTIAPSTLVGVYGESGIGKSVLINSLVAPDGGNLQSGSMLVDGVEPVSGNPGIAYLPQRLNFPDTLKAREIVRQGTVRSGCSRERKKRILELCHVKLDGPGGWGNQRFRALSGGQQRRLALAMALLDDRVRLVVADEPTTGFDIGTERDVMRGLRRLVRLENITVIVVTHSVFALPIFDKVLVLSKCKSEKKSGAGLCFDSMWLPEFFPKKLKQIPQDADRLTALYEGLVSQNRAVKLKLQSPYYHEKPKPGIVRKLHSFGRQCITWTSNCSKMALRQKTFARFVGLSFLCVLMIQLGTCCSSRFSEIFLSFMALCAPWLCATYTAMFGSELLGWYSWEKLSGGSSRGFCFGVLGGLLLPYMCISLIFTMGLFFPPNMERIVDEAYIALSRMNVGTCVSRYIADSDKSSYDSEMQSRSFRKDQRVLKDPPQLMVGDPELGCEDSQGKCYRRDYASVNRERADNSLRSWMPWRLVGVQWVLLTLICLVGGTMGLAAIAWFRDAKSAVLLVVILFIGFIMLSRVCVEFTGCMYALKFSSGSVLSDTDVRWIPLVYLSYLGIGRYAYNVLVYPLQGAYLYDWLPLLGWATGCLIITLRRLANPMQNWKAFER